MRTMMTVVAAALVVSACATASDVVPIGPNRYKVTGNAHGMNMGGHSQIEATKKAGEYCAAQHKSLNVESSTTDGNVVWSQEISEVIFSCN